MKKLLRCTICNRRRKKSHDRKFVEHVIATRMNFAEVAKLSESSSDLISQLENAFK